MTCVSLPRNRDQCFQSARVRFVEAPRQRLSRSSTPISGRCRRSAGSRARRAASISTATLADWGRRNERAAETYSLVGTAGPNGLDVKVQLRHVLWRSPDFPVNRVDELLPWAIAVELPSLRMTA